MNGFARLGLVIAIGSLWGAQEPKSPTFSEDIRPIIQKKCLPCHQTNGMGPFALQTFDQVKRRGDLVRLVSLTGQMPPTDARSDVESLTPHQPLDSRELKIIQEWYRLGMPEGKKMSPLPQTPTLKPESSSKRLVVHVGRGQVIPAEGRYATVVYRLSSFSGKQLNLKTFAFQPDSPQAVKQVVLAVQRKGQPVPFTSTGIRSGTTYATWAAGFNLWRGDIELKKEDRLWIRLSTVPTGKQEPASGLVIFDRGPGLGQVQTQTLGNRTFRVEPEQLAVLRDEWVLASDIDLVSVLPEARFVTDQIRLIAKDDQGERNLLMVHTWDATWPGAYNFLRPVRLKKGTTIVYEASITNSKHGHAAVDEKSTLLLFGPKPTDELFWCHLNYISR